MALGDFARVVLHSQWQTQAGVNVLHYVQTSNNAGEITTVTLKALADAVSGSVGLAVRETMSASAEYQGCEAYWPFRGDLGTPQISYKSNVSAGPGTFADSEQIAPTQLAGLITKRTGFTGRTGRGRAYIPFPPFGAITADDDLLANAYLTLLTDVAVAMAEPKVFTAGGQSWTWTPCLVKADGPLIQPFRTLISCTARRGFATQRRRGYFGRVNNPWEV